MSEIPGFIDPSATAGAGVIALAPRPANLRGLVVGLLDNHKEQADIILETMGEALRARYGVAKIVMRRKEHYSRTAPDRLIDEMAQEVQIAIAAVGG
jgi:hypothetical protein